MRAVRCLRQQDCLRIMQKITARLSQWFGIEEEKHEYKKSKSSNF